MRILLKALFRFCQANIFEQGQGSIWGFLPAALPVLQQGFTKLFLNRTDWIERGHRLLENHRDPGSPDFPILTFREAS